MTQLLWFCAVGGALLLVIGIVADGLIDGLLDALPFGDDGAVLPALGAFLGTFGIVGLTGSAMTGSPSAAVIAGAGAAGVITGALTLRLVRTAVRMPTDATPTSSDLVGSFGKVVTPVTADAAGEVLVRLAGQPHKLMARADTAIATGTKVVVVEVLSPSSVRIEPESSFFGGGMGELPT